MQSYRSSKKQISLDTQSEAVKIAHGRQRPGQTKEHTKLIAQGIQKGIEQYKKQQSTKARELDKKLKKVSKQQMHQQPIENQTGEIVRYKQHWLPWLLLILTWSGIAGYFIIL